LSKVILRTFEPGNFRPDFLAVFLVFLFAFARFEFFAQGSQAWGVCHSQSLNVASMLLMNFSAFTPLFNGVISLCNGFRG
jgi:hypothetical protein